MIIKIGNDKRFIDIIEKGFRIRDNKFLSVNFTVFNSNQGNRMMINDAKG